MAENEDDPREKFYVVEFSIGHTSPSLDTIAQCLGYIEHYSPIWEQTEHKKPKEIIIRVKYRLPGVLKAQKQERERMAQKARVSARLRKIKQIEERLTKGK